MSQINLTALKTASLVMLLTAICAGTASADDDYVGDKLSAATLSCGGNHSDAVVNNTVYSLRNLNNTQSIIVDSIVIRDARANVIFDYPNMNSVPGKIRTTLGPRESTRIFTTDILTGVPIASRPLQTDISWHAANNSDVRPLRISVTRITGDGRSAGSCTYLKTAK